MNKSMLMGMVAGIGVATAGGVLGYQFLGERPAGDGAVETDQVVASGASRADSRSPGPGVLGRGGPRHGRPQGRASHRGHGDRRRRRWRHRQGRRRSRHHDGGGCGCRRSDRPRGPRGIPGKQRRQAHDDDRRAALRTGGQRSSLRLKLFGLRAEPANGSALLFPPDVAKRNANDLQQRWPLGTLAVHSRRTALWFGRRFSGSTSCAAWRQASSC